MLSTVFVSPVANPKRIWIWKSTYQTEIQGGEVQNSAENLEKRQKIVTLSTEKNIFMTHRNPSFNAQKLLNLGPNLVKNSLKRSSENGPHTGVWNLCITGIWTAGGALRRVRHSFSELPVVVFVFAHHCQKLISTLTTSGTTSKQ